jgi:type II secretory pathway component PulL
MPGKILGLDIREDYIAAVQVISGLKGYQVTSCFGVKIEEGKGIDKALLEISREIDLKSDNCFASIPGGYMSYRNLGMPFKNYKKINDTLPFEIETVSPFPIEEMIIDFNVIESSEQSEILAVSTEKTYVSRYLEVLNDFGIEPDIIDISPVPTVLWLLNQGDTPRNGLFLDIGFNRNSMILFLNNRINLIRSFAYKEGTIPFAVLEDHSEIGPGEGAAVQEVESRLGLFCESVRKTIHSFGAQTKREINLEKVFFSGLGMLYSRTGEILSGFLDRPAQEVNVRGDRDVDMDFNIDRAWNAALMDGALALALRDSKKGEGFNLRKGEFELKKSYLGPINEIRKAIILLGALFLFILVNLGVDYYFLNKRCEAGEQKVTGLFRQAFPEVTNVRFPVLQMKQKIKELETSSGLLPGGVASNRKALDVLRDISQRIPTSLDVDVSNMVIDGEKVRISGDTDTFSTVEDLKNSLEPSDYFKSVTLGPANLDRTGKRVNFEITMQRAE